MRWSKNLFYFFYFKFIRKIYCGGTGVHFKDSELLEWIYMLIIGDVTMVRICSYSNYRLNGNPADGENFPI